MTLFLTLWVTAALFYIAGTIVIEGTRGWDYRDPARCVAAGITTAIFMIPAVYELGWVALPMAMGR